MTENTNHTKFMTNRTFFGLLGIIFMVAMAVFVIYAKGQENTNKRDEVGIIKNTEGIIDLKTTQAVLLNSVETILEDVKDIKKFLNVK